MRCFERVDVQNRQLVFERFWALADYNVQNAYLFGQMESRQRSRRYHKLQRVVGQSRRTRTWKYTAVTVSSCRFMGFVRHVFVLLEVSVSHLKFSHLLIAGLTMKLGHERYQMKVSSVCEITSLPSRDTLLL